MAANPYIAEDLQALALGLSQLGMQLRVAQDKAHLGWSKAGAGLAAALSLVERLGAEQGDIVRGLGALDGEARCIAASVSEGATEAIGLAASLQRDREEGAAIQATLREALEGAKALIDLAGAMSGDDSAGAPEADVPEPETAVLAAHWHVL